MAKVVITCAPIGAETTREQNPALPQTPDEIADDANQARQAGAAILHLHVRNTNGQPTQDPAVYKDTAQKIQSQTDIIVEFSTGGAVGMSPAERLAPVALAPEMASLDCGTVNFGHEHIINTLPMLSEYAAEFERHGVHPTLECFDLSHIHSARALIDEGLLPPPHHFGLVLGVPGALPYSPHILATMLRELPPEALWTVIGIGGRAARAAVSGAIAFGGFARVGFEDNVYYAKGRLAKSNAELVEQAATMIRAAGHQPATPDEAREILGLPYRKEITK